MTNQPFIRLDNLYKAFGPKKVLQGFSLSLEKGDSVVIIGGSGSGKSVLLKNLLGLLDPDQGEIYLEGERISHGSRKEREIINRRFGMLFQNAALFDSLPVWENIAFGLIQGEGMERRKARDIAAEKLSLVGLGSEVISLYPDELSGGMRKRVGLARAIANNPEIILFDEPTTGLDPIMGHVIDALISDLVKKLGITAISITHDMPSARRISNRVAMLFQGRCVWSGPTHEIDATDNAIVRQFVKGEIEGPIQMEIRPL